VASLADFTSVLERFDGLKYRRDMASAICPLKQHRNARVSFWVRGDALLFGCWACGVSAKPEILRAVGLRFGQLFHGSRIMQCDKAKMVARYPYRDETGKLLFEACRFEPGFEGKKKSIRYRRPLLTGKGWEWTIEGCRRVLYRLPELLATPTRVLWVVGGEKKADMLAALGFVSTCCPCGERSWLPEYGTYLRGRHVIVVPDLDDAGRGYTLTVAGSAVVNSALSLRVWSLDGVVEPGQGIDDWITEMRREHSQQELREAIKTTVAALGAWKT
jgi:hypothetical protein